MRDVLTIHNFYTCTDSSSTILFPHLRFLFTFTGMYMYFWIGGCRSMQQSGLSLLLCLPFCTLFHSLSTVAFASGINNAWGERSFAHALGFPKQVSLKNRSPESSEPYVTLDSRSSLIRTLFGVHTSFFPSSHLRVSRTHQAFRVNGKIVPQIRRVARGDSMRLLSH